MVQLVGAGQIQGDGNGGVATYNDQGASLVTMGSMDDRGIGFTAHLLHHSLVADAHRPEHGPVTEAGNIVFIEVDGSLRSGHEFFNEY
jgi:hypothetical protein